MMLSIPTLILLILFVLIELNGREEQYAIAKMFNSRSRGFRWAFYYLILIALFVFAGSDQQFIYFQF